MDRQPGLTDLDDFYRRTNAQEDVVVHPVGRSGEPFVIAALFDGKDAMLPPAATVYVGDEIVRQDARGGETRYLVTDHVPHVHPNQPSRSFSLATLVDRQQVDRDQTRPTGGNNFYISGGHNQLAVGDGNRLQQENHGDGAAVSALLASIIERMPRELLPASVAADIEDAVEETREVLASGPTPSKMKRSLRALKGTVEDVVTSARAGLAVGVKTWASTSVAAVMQQIDGL